MQPRPIPAQRSRQPWHERATEDAGRSKSESSRGPEAKRKSWRSRVLRAILVPIAFLFLGFVGGVAFMRGETEKGGLLGNAGEPGPGVLTAWSSPREVAPEASPQASPDEATAVSNSADSTVLAGVTKTLKEQFAAFNAEDMDRLKGTFSAEADFHPRDLAQVEGSLSVNDQYHRLDHVEILSESDSPGAEFEAPYTTIAVTQTTLSLPPSDPRNKVFRRRAEKDDSDLEGLAEQLGYKNRNVVTTRIELLFVQEAQEWKFVSAVSAPVMVNTRGSEAHLGAPIPFPILRRPGRSAF